MTTKRLGSIVTHLVAVVACFIIAAPFLWMVSTSLKDPQELNLPTPTLVPHSLYLGNFSDVWVRSDFGIYFLNSVIIATATTLISVFLATMAGYAFARFALPGGKALLLGILATQMFPGILLAIPLYIVMRNLNLIDSRLSLVISYTSFALPFCIWMLRNYFLTVPRELDEAAMVDGCTQLSALWRVILPLARPGIAATSVFSFILAWDEFLYANTFINSADLRTVSIGLQSLIGQYSTNWGLLMAGTVIATVPIVIFFMFVQRNLTEVVGGSLKG